MQRSSPNVPFNRNDSKTMECIKCGDLVHNVSKQAASVTCWKCTMNLIKNNNETTNRNTDSK